MKDSPAKLRAERELSEKFERNIIFRDTFKPNIAKQKKSTVTGKFYSRHQALDLRDADQEMLNAIWASNKDIKERIKKPDSVNHSYGWYCNPLVKVNRNDRRYYRPLVSNENTKTMMTIANDRSLKREKFTGIPFKL